MKVQRINIYRPAPGTIRRVVDVVGVGNQIDAMRTLLDWFQPKQGDETLEHIQGDMWRFTQEFRDDN